MKVTYKQALILLQKYCIDFPEIKIWIREATKKEQNNAKNKQ